MNVHLAVVHPSPLAAFDFLGTHFHHPPPPPIHHSQVTNILQEDEI